MIFLKTLGKGFFNKKTGERIVELVRGIFDFTSLDGFNQHSVYRVTDETAMRPDLLSHFIYRDQNLMDHLLKFNGISNPFSIYPGQIIYAPLESDMLACTRPLLEIVSDRSPKSSKLALIKPKTQRDKSRLDHLNKIAKDPVAPPNVTLPGDKNIKIIGGSIVFGDDVTQVKKRDCPEPLSRTRIKEALITNKIFKQ